MKRNRYSEPIIGNIELWKELNKRVLYNAPYISATKTRNYLLKDPVLDWLKTYYLKLGYGDQNIKMEKINSDKKFINRENYILENTLFNKGNIFEQKVLEELEIKVGKNNCISVINNFTECDIEKMKDTIKYMKQGIYIIKHAVLYNEINKTFGIADFLIRSDIINKIFTDNIDHIDKDEEKIGCKYSNNYHYRVVDIKWSQLQLCSDGKRILNCDNYPAYKGQLAIYNLALGIIQNYIPNTAYLLGKSYKYECQSRKYYGNNSFMRFGHILYDNYDSEYIKLTKNALDWYREMKNEGHNWNLLQSDRIELCPNMCNTADSPYSNIKHELAKKKHEITCLWNVGPNNRKKAFDNNIYKWKDDKCTSNLLGLNGKTALIVDRILDVNRSSDSNIKYYPNKIVSTLYDWRNQDNYFDFYIDFETINDVYYNDNISINNKQSENFIFMIGVGYINDNNEWIFNKFYLNKLNSSEETIMINEFQKYILHIFSQYKTHSINKIRFVHWSQAEVNFLDKFNEKNNNILANFIKLIQFTDLYKIFISEPITIKGSLTFKLKDITNALCNLGIIKSNWNNVNITNGFTAMLDGIAYYKAVDNNNVTREMEDVFKEIINYNELDCKVMYDILNWMRKSC